MNRLLALFGALLLAFYAQQIFTGADPGVPRDGLLLYVAAALLFIWSTARPAPLRVADRVLWRAWTRPGLALVVAGLAAAGASLLLLWSDLQNLPGLLLWPLAAVLYLAGAFWEKRHPAPVEQPDAKAPAVLAAQGATAGPRGGQWLREHWDLLVLAAIVVVAIFVRFYQLEVFPNGCQSDECNNGLDALKWLAGAPYTPYAETNEGQATFFTYLIALSFQLFGVGVAQMRMVSAAVGVLTVLAFYYLARDLYGRYPALVATALFATSRWHVTFSRIVYELIMQPLALILLVFFLLRGLRDGRRRDWALAGLMLTVGMNTYTAFRIVPLIVALFLAFWLVRALVMAWRSRRAIWPAVRQDVDGIAVMAGGVFVTILPLGVYILQNWDIFTGRIRKIGIMDEVARAGSWEPVRANLLKALSMFHWQGDGAALNNLPGAPMFDTLVAIFFILGMGYSLWYALQLRSLPVLYILWFAGILSLGVFSATHEAPTARRTIGIAPLGYLMVALVADQVFARWRQTWRGMGNRVLGFATAALVIVVVFGNARTYFAVQALHPDVWAAYSPVESAIGRYLVDLPADATVLVDPRFEHHSAVRLIGRERPFRAFDPIRDIPFRVQAGDAASANTPGAQLIYVLDPVDKPLVALLETIYPAGQAQEHRDRYDRLHFLSFAVGIAQAQAMQGLVGNFYPAAQPDGAPAATLATAALDLDLAQAPLAPPFAATWSGTLLVDEFGEYAFDLRAAGDHATLQIDQQAALSVRGDGQNTLTMTLPAGFHSLRLDYASGADPGRVQVRWSGPRGGEEILGAGALYAFDLGQRGLIGYYYPNAGWQDPPALVRTDLLITANTLLPVPYSVRWLGKLAAPVSGDYILGTLSDDGSFVYVDGQLVVDNGGVHGAEERQGAIYLEQGFHDIEVRYFEDGGSRELQLWWQPPGQGRSVVDNSYLFPLSGAALPADLALPSLPAIAAELAPVGVASGELGDADRLPGTATIVASGFQQPRGIAVDAAGRFYVAESATGKVQVMAPDGTRLSVLPPGADRFQDPTDVIADVAGVSVLDGSGRVLQYTPDGELRAKIGEATHSFDRSRGLGGDVQGKIWVANTPAGTVLTFDASGALTQQLPVWPGEDAQPVDVQVGLDGRIFVTDAGRARLVRYGADGQRERAWNIAPANSVDSPHLALDAQGRLYMTEPESGRVLQLDPAGELLGIWDLPAQLGRFVKPVGIAVGPDGRVWVTDADGGNVIVIDPAE